MRTRKRQILCPALTAGLLSGLAWAQGGPPFRTDDPETPGNRQWEINLGLIGDRNRSQGFYDVPNLDINFGLGNCIQLKYEVPLGMLESRGSSEHVVAGLGNSLLGIKWRFYEHHEDRSPEAKPNFSVSVYPQLMLNNPTRSVARGIVDAGPQFLLPLEANATFGPIRIVGEVGYWFTSKNLAEASENSWIRGVMVGHEFKSKTELYLEFHDQAEVNHGPRETTLGIGGRQPISPHGSVLFTGMLGRSLVKTTATNGQPDWIAYVGIQFLAGHHHRIRQYVDDGP